MIRLWALALVALVLAAATGGAFAQGAPMFGGFLATSNAAILIDAQSLERRQDGGREVLQYAGGVVARRGDMEIRADSLTVFLPRPGDTAGVTFDRIEATGNVAVTSGVQRATANRAVMDMVAQTVVMTGNVALADGANQMSGQTFTVDLATGGWRLETGGNNRVQTVINPGR